MRALIIPVLMIVLLAVFTIGAYYLGKLILILLKEDDFDRATTWFVGFMGLSMVGIIVFACVAFSYKI